LFAHTVAFDYTISAVYQWLQGASHSMVRDISKNFSEL